MEDLDRLINKRSYLDLLHFLSGGGFFCGVLPTRLAGSGPVAWAGELWTRMSEKGGGVSGKVPLPSFDRSSPMGQWGLLGLVLGLLYRPNLADTLQPKSLFTQLHNKLPARATGPACPCFGHKKNLPVLLPAGF